GYRNTTSAGVNIIGGVITSASSDRTSITVATGPNIANDLPNDNSTSRANDPPVQSGDAETRAVKSIIVGRLKSHDKIDEDVDLFNSAELPNPTTDLYEMVNNLISEDDEDEEMDISSDEGSESDFSDLEILEKKDKPLQQLRNETLKVKYPGGILRCPLCKGKKKQNFKYEDLHQHASGVSK
ncbi:XH/XS domain-containing protein, partial [Tanacetum coccineum]